MSPSSFLTLAGGLALCLASSAIAEAGATHGARMAPAARVSAQAAPRVISAAPRVISAAPRVISAAPPALHAAPRRVVAAPYVSAIPAVRMLAQPSSAPAVVHAQSAARPVALHAPHWGASSRSTGRASLHAHPGPRIVHLGGRDPGGINGRHYGRISIVGGIATAPIYYAATRAPQPQVENLPVEPPLTAVYGEPQIIEADSGCAQPAVHHIGRPASHGRLPQVIYGLQPPCGPAIPAPAPAEISRGQPRAAK